MVGFRVCHPDVTVPAFMLVECLRGWLRAVAQIPVDNDYCATQIRMLSLEVLRLSFF
jgi:hypothetical protein